MPRRFLIVACAASGVWWLTLAAMAIFTANPTTLNREQVLASDYVVTGRVSSGTPGSVEIEREWMHDAKLGAVRVGNLEQAGAKPGRRYLIPLTKSGSQAFHVTETRLPDRPPIVYPADPEALEQLRFLLEKERRGDGLPRESGP